MTTEKAIQFKQDKYTMWAPISLLGYDSGRFFMEDWIISKNKFTKFVESY